MNSKSSLGLSEKMRLIRPNMFQMNFSKPATAITSALVVIFAMEYDPPINTRTNEQLIEIIETKEEWQPDVVNSAKTELTKRGIPLEIPELRKKNNNKLKLRIETIKARATYTSLEKLLIVLLGPILVFILDDLFVFYPGEGFRKKNRQGLFYLLLGFFLWGTMMYIFFEYY